MSPHLKRQTATVIDSDAVLIGQAYRRGLIAHVEAGRMLAAKKAALKHGQWLPWLAKHKDALGFEVLTAQRLMKLASENTSLATLSADEAEITQRLWGHKSRWHYPTDRANDECYTPVPILKVVRKVLGTIDLDPASCDEAQQLVQARKYFTKNTDGLKQQWRGPRVFLNPPYSTPKIRPFIEKFLQEYSEGRITEAIVLTSNQTDTRWAQALLNEATVICFWKGRISFHSSRSPLWGSIFSYFGKNKDKFAKVFGEHGFIR